MAATLQIISQHGAAGATETQVDGATFRFRRSDVDTQDTVNPIPRPAAGTNYSWRKNLKAKVTVTPAGFIQNLRFFSDGIAIATGCAVYALLNASYVQGAVGDETAQMASSADATTYTSGSPLTVNAGNVLSNPTTGYGSQSYVQLQFAAGTTAVRGIKGPQTYTYRWDEV